MRCQTALLVLLSALLAGCTGLSREVNQALPEFMRADPGAKEMKIFEDVRRGRSWTEQDLQAQDEQMGQIRTAETEGRHEDAVGLCESYLEAFPTSKHDEEVRFLLVEANYLDDEFGDAFRALRDYSTLYPVTERAPRLMEMEYDMGRRFLSGERNTFFGIISNTKRGEEMLNHLVETFPRGSLAPDAQWTLASWYFEQEDWIKGEAAFDLLIVSYPKSEWYPPALFNAAYCTYRQVKGSEYDPEVRQRARERFRDYLEKSGDPIWGDDAKAIIVELEALDAEHLLLIGDWYRGQGKPYSARYYFTSVITKYPNSGPAEEARAYLGELTPEEPVAPDPAPAETGEESSDGAGA